MNEKYLRWFAAHKKRIYEQLFQLLSFPSISTDPAYASSVRQCAQFLQQQLYLMGYEVEEWPTEGHPVVFAQLREAGVSKPTILLYLHYDVQPAEPLELWDSDPFAPEIRDGHVYARGAVDNKGQAAYTLAALHAFREIGRTDGLNIKVLIEGEEEVGSSGLQRLFVEKKEALQADYALIVDVGIESLAQPAVTVGCRGIATLNCTVTTARSDLHSGAFGGIAHNPNRLLIEAMSGAWDAEGHIAIPSFYDGIEPFSEEEKALLQRSYSIDDAQRSGGLLGISKEAGYAPYEQNWLRPTLEVNGLCGGYTGDGCKTVIPQSAHIKLSSRLVPGQSPEHVLEMIERFLRDRLPAEVDVSFSDKHAAPAFRTSLSSSFAEIVRGAYSGVLAAECGSILCGGSIPITKPLQEASGAQLLLMGYGLLDDRMHAPNERFALDRFEYGFLTVAQIFEKLSGIC